MCIVKSFCIDPSVCVETPDPLGLKAQSCTCNIHLPLGVKPCFAVLSAPQGDDFVAGLVDGSLLSSEKFSTLRLAGCGLGDMGAVRLAKAVEAVGKAGQPTQCGLMQAWYYRLHRNEYTAVT